MSKEEYIEVIDMRYKPFVYINKDFIKEHGKDLGYIGLGLLIAFLYAREEDGEIIQTVAQFNANDRVNIDETIESIMKLHDLGMIDLPSGVAK